MASQEQQVPMQEASKKGLDKLRQFNLNMHRGVKITDEMLTEMAGMMKPDINFIFFWGKCCCGSDEWVEETKEMMAKIAVDKNARVHEEELKVVIETDTHCMLQAKNVLHKGNFKEACYGTLLFEKDTTAPHGVSLAHYQETRIEAESVGFFEAERERKEHGVSA